MSMNGQGRPMSADLTQPLYADGGGAGMLLGALPLAAGYQATFQNFDLMKAKVKTMDVAVVGEEKVTVPAGTFDAWKLQVSSEGGTADKVTYWIDKATRKNVKVAATMPQLGGATLTSELQ